MVQHRSARLTTKLSKLLLLLSLLVISACSAETTPAESPMDTKPPSSKLSATPKVVEKVGPSPSPQATQEVQEAEKLATKKALVRELNSAIVPPEEGLFLVSNGEAKPLHMWDLVYEKLNELDLWRLPSDYESAVWYPTSYAISDRTPFVLLKSGSISPTDVEFYYIKPGIGISFRNSDAGCMIGAVVQTCDLCGASSTRLSTGDLMVSVDGMDVANCDQLKRALVGPLFSTALIGTLQGTRRVEVPVRRDCVLNLSSLDASFSLEEDYARFYFPEPLPESQIFVVTYDRESGTGYADSFLVNDAKQTIPLFDDPIEQCTEIGGAEHYQQDMPVAFSPGGDILATMSSVLTNTVVLWHIPEGEVLHVLERDQARAWTGTFSPSGETLAIGYDDGSVSLWDVEDGKKIYTLQIIINQAWPIQLRFSPDGKRLITSVAGYGYRPQIWSVSDGSLIGEFEGGDTTLSPDGKMLATVSSDGNLICLRNTLDGQRLRCLKFEDGFESEIVGFSPDNEILTAIYSAVSERKTLVHWRVADGELLETYDLSAPSNFEDWSIVSPDGAVAAWRLSTDEYQFRRVSDGEVVFELEDYLYGIWKLAFSPDGKTLVTEGDDDFFFWRLSDGQLLHRTEKEQNWASDYLLYSPDGKLLAAGGWEESIKLYKVSGY